MMEPSDMWVPPDFRSVPVDPRLKIREVSNEFKRYMYKDTRTSFTPGPTPSPRNGLSIDARESGGGVPGPPGKPGSRVASSPLNGGDGSLGPHHGGGRQPLGRCARPGPTLPGRGQPVYKPGVHHQPGGDTARERRTTPRSGMKPRPVRPTTPKGPIRALMQAERKYEVTYLVTEKMSSKSRSQSAASCGGTVNRTDTPRSVPATPRPPSSASGRRKISPARRKGPNAALTSTTPHEHGVVSDHSDNDALKFVTFADIEKQHEKDLRELGMSPTRYGIEYRPYASSSYLPLSSTGLHATYGQFTFNKLDIWRHPHSPFTKVVRGYVPYFISCVRKKDLCDRYADPPPPQPKQQKQLIHEDLPYHPRTRNPPSETDSVDSVSEIEELPGEIPEQEERPEEHSDDDSVQIESDRTVSPTPPQEPQIAWRHPIYHKPVEQPAAPSIRPPSPEPIPLVPPALPVVIRRPISPPPPPLVFQTGDETPEPEIIITPEPVIIKVEQPEPIVEEITVPPMPISRPPKRQKSPGLLDMKMKQQRRRLSEVPPEMIEPPPNAKDRPPRHWVTRIALSKKSCRFELPMDMNDLRVMTPIEYLGKFCVIEKHREVLYKKLFHGVRKPRERDGCICYNDVEKGLSNLHVDTITTQQFLDVMNLIEADHSRRYSFDLFSAICALSERILFNTFGNEDGRHYYQKERVEDADFTGLDWKLEEMFQNRCIYIHNHPYVCVCKAGGICTLQQCSVLLM